MDRAERHYFFTTTFVILSPFLFPPNKKQCLSLDQSNDAYSKKVLIKVNQ